MKLFSNKKYNVILKYVIITIIISLLLVLALFRWGTLKTAASVVMNVLEPIIWGAVIAFIMNPIMMSTEKFLNNKIFRKIFKKKQRPRLARAIGVIVSALVFIAVIMAIILSVIPEVLSNLPGIYSGITNDLIPKVEAWAQKLLTDYPSVRDIVVNELSDISTTLQKLLSSLGPKLQNFLVSLLDFANSVKNFVFGIIIAIYFLLSKEELQAQAKKLIVANFKPETYHRIFDFVSNTNKALLGFIYGKVIDSIIIGVLCFLGMLAFNMPYVLIISIIIGITNIIPIFGPFIGAIPSALLILIADPKKVIWFIIFVIALQQLDGNIIGPKILGSKIGLSPFWMLFSIIIFGSMFGIVGMIIGVPLFAVAYDLVTGSVNARLAKKNMPTDDGYYMMKGEDIGKVVNEIPPQEAAPEIEIKEQGAQELPKNK